MFLNQSFKADELQTELNELRRIIFKPIKMSHYSKGLAPGKYGSNCIFCTFIVIIYTIAFINFNEPLLFNSYSRMLSMFHEAEKLKALAAQNKSGKVPI